MSFCANCGVAAAGGRFCGTCGAPLSSDASGEPSPAAASLPPSASPASSSAPPAPVRSGPAAAFAPPAAAFAPPEPAQIDPAATGRFAGIGHSQTDPGGSIPAPTVAPKARTGAPMAVTDVVRDIGALIVLIWTLTIAWSPEGTGGKLVYVLLTVLCSIASLLPIYLQRVMVRPDGRPAQWQTGGLRVLMNAPLAVVILVTVIRNVVGAVGHSGLSALGPGVATAAFGMALAAVPRVQELRGRGDGREAARRWRRAAGWAAGLGIASILVTTLVALAPFRGLGSGGALVLLILTLLGTVLFFLMVLAVPPLRVGADHPAWQPTALWLGSMFVLILLVVASRSATYGNPTALESAAGSFYGIWLLALAAGLCALPLQGGRDGSPETAQFWGLVVANAFRVIVIGCAVAAGLGLLTIIEVQRGGQVPGELIWAVIAAVICLLAAAIGSSQLRANIVTGRRVALGCLAVMALVTVITMAMDGFSSVRDDGASGAIGIPLLIGSYVVIVFGLTAPKPIREMVVAHRPRPTVPPAATSSAAPAVASPPSVGTPAFPSAADEPTMWNPSAYPTPESELSAAAADGMTVRVVPTAGADPDDVERTVMRPRRSPSPVATAESQHSLGAEDPQVAAASNPTTPLSELMTIAQTRPDLRAAVAANPSTYPDLLTWLGELGDLRVNAALAARPRAAAPPATPRSTPRSTPPPAPAATAAAAPLPVPVAVPLEMAPPPRVPDPRTRTTTQQQRLDLLSDGVAFAASVADHDNYLRLCKTTMGMFAVDVADMLADGERVPFATPCGVTAAGKPDRSAFLVVTESRAILAWQTGLRSSTKHLQVMPLATIGDIAAEHVRLGAMAGWRTMLRVRGEQLWELQIVDTDKGAVGNMAHGFLNGSITANYE